MQPDFLSRVPLFSVLSQDEIAQLMEMATLVSLAAGDYLFRRGDRGDALFVVEAGLMEAVIDEDTPSERALNTLFPGDFFGEMALLTEGPRSASARAIIDSQLIRISHEQFTRLLVDKPTIALHLSKVLSNYLSRTNAQLSRESVRINTIIPICDPLYAHAMAGLLSESLERQFNHRCVFVILGDSGLPDAVACTSDNLSNILGHIGQLQSGGDYLWLGGSLLQDMDDQAMVAIINSLRHIYSHILIWTSPAEARKRISFLTRFDQTFLLAETPFEPARFDILYKGINQALKSSFRMAIFVTNGQSVPSMSSTVYPPIKLHLTRGDDREAMLISKGSVDRLARALAGLTVGLALGSGTAQGLSHLGVMRALIEAGIPIDLIAGTSGGALYGSMVASGLTVDESVSKVVHHTRRNLIDKLDFTLPRRGLIRGRRIERMVQSCIGDLTFSELPIPLYAVAADLDTGEEVIIRDGIVYRGVRASISVPGIFEPYDLDGRILIDGVAVNPLPVSVARSMGANIVIAVQVPAPGKVAMEANGKSRKRRKKNVYNIVSSVVRSHHFVGDRLADKSASEADVFIKPDVTRFGWREYRSAPAIIEAGYQAGQAAIKRISELIWGT